MSRKTSHKPKRTWVPQVGYSTSVARWEWTSRDGLRVVYKDGLRCKSDWGTLRDFLTAIKEGREHAREVTEI